VLTQVDSPGQNARNCRLAEFLTILQGRWREVRPITAAQSEFERARGAICEKQQRVLLGPDDSVWREVAQDGHSKFRGALL
jgi:hypothetical protein